MTVLYRPPAIYRLVFFTCWWTQLHDQNEKLGSVTGNVTRVTLRLIFTDYECAHVGVETDIDFTICNYLAGSFHSVTGTRCPIVTVD